MRRPSQATQDTFNAFGTDWNSKNAVPIFARQLLANELPFQLGLQGLRQRLLMGQMGGGLGMQDVFRNASMGNAEAMQNQARAQGMAFNPMDYQSQALMDANAGLRNYLANRPMQQLGLATQGFAPYGDISQMSIGMMDTPKQPGFFGQLAGTVGQTMGMGWNPFARSAPQANPGQQFGQQIYNTDWSSVWR